MKTFGSKGKKAVTLDKNHAKALQSIAKEAECSVAHALKWAIRTLADKRGVKISS